MTDNYAHILLVEDNQDDYEATVRSLKKNHFLNPVVWCKNGQSALDYLLKEGDYAHSEDVKRPDLVLLDLNMPGVDGRTVLKRMKAREDLRSIPVVILTTSKDSQDIESCYEMGASTYIQKPVSFEGLTEAIRTMKDYWFGVAILPKHVE
jgi:CheY-like chemotaxis protein